MIEMAHLLVSLVLVCGGVFVTFGLGPALIVAGAFLFGMWLMQDVD